MRIIVDINHPADVHIFRNYIRIMENRGHSILITASQKEISYELLNNYGFDYEKLGEYGKSLISKVISIPLLDFKSLTKVKNFKPDMFIGFGSIRNAHVSRILRKICINLDDTEHAKWEHLLYVPFTDKVLTPNSFLKNFGIKQVRYNGYKELTYLHPKYFKPNYNVLTDIGLNKNDCISIIRLVSWEASHDYGQKGIDDISDLVKTLERFGRVYISSENTLPKKLTQYKLTVPPHKLHDLLYYSTLYVGEGATTASEAVVLGTHAIYVNTLKLGYLIDQQARYGLVYNYNDKNVFQNVKAKAVELLTNNNLRLIGKQKRNQIISDHIDVNSYLVSYTENYYQEVVNSRR